MCTCVLCPTPFHTGPLQVATLGGGNTVVGEGLISIDASGSRDPDGEPGSLFFSWVCSPPNGGAQLPGALVPPIAGYSGCQTANGTALSLSEASSPAVAVQLLGTPAGANYTLSVRVEKGDRVAYASVWLVVRAGVRLPVISLQGLAMAKANPDAKLTLQAAVSSAYPASLTTAWSVVSAPAAFNLSAAADTPLSLQSLVVRAGTLPPRSTVVFRLSAQDLGGTSTADVAIPVSGTPEGPSGSPKGSFSVSPSAGLGLETRFSLRADNWTADASDLPLSYAFFYSVDGADGPPVSLLDFKPQSATSGVLLPAGDPSGNSTISVFCVVQNAFGVTQMARAHTGNLRQLPTYLPCHCSSSFAAGPRTTCLIPEIPHFRVSARAQSDPVKVGVTWDQSMLTDPDKQSALVATQSAAAMAQARLIWAGWMRVH